MIVFLFQNPELLKWFQDFVGFKEGGVPTPKESGAPKEALMTDPVPPHQPMTQPRHERMSGDAAMEIGTDGFPTFDMRFIPRR